MHDLIGIPCKHDISIMTYASLELEEFVTHWYSREKYIKCYKSCIHPLNGPQMWHKTGLLPLEPPIYNRLSDRHKKNRRSEMDKKKKKLGANPFKLGTKY